MGQAEVCPISLMAAKKKTEPLEIPVEEKEPTDLEKVEAELREISPTLSGLKHNNPAKYKEVYRHYMWLVSERDRIKAEA